LLRSSAAVVAGGGSPVGSGSPSHHFQAATSSFTGSTGSVRRPYPPEDIIPHLHSSSHHPSSSAASRYHSFASGTHSSSFGAPATATSPDLVAGDSSFRGLRPTFRKSSSQPQPHHHHRSLSPPLLRGP